MKRSDRDKEKHTQLLCTVIVACSPSMEKRRGKTALSLEVSFEYLDALDMIYTPAWLLTAQWFTTFSCKPDAHM